jgi:serine kinase of HPr protein (carbohydrate metabolism regulator)
MTQSYKLENLHATALTIGDRGVLVRGASGSGKTTVALALLQQATTAGYSGRLVADDQVLLSPANGRLICIAPPAIAGLIEVRGSSPQAIAFEPAAVIDLVIDLVDPENAPRYAEGALTEIAGCALPLLALPARNASAALIAAAAYLRLTPFG